MTWARLDDRFPSHRKTLRLSDAAFRLFVTSVCFCCEQLTDGRIEAGIPETLPRAPRGARLRDAVAELEAAGLWETHAEGGWSVHDFLDWNPPADRVTAQRAAAKDRMRRAREQRVPANVRANVPANAPPPVRAVFARTDGEQDANFAGSSPNPVPVPVPEERDLPPQPPPRVERPAPPAAASPRPRPADPLGASFAPLRADVVELHAAWQRSTGLTGHRLRGGSSDFDATTLVEAIDGHGLADCLAVARWCMRDRMVSGDADERGQPHTGIRYVFGNEHAFARILKAARDAEAAARPKRDAMADWERRMAADVDPRDIAEWEQRNRARATPAGRTAARGEADA